MFLAEELYINGSGIARTKFSLVICMGLSLSTASKTLDQTRFRILRLCVRSEPELDAKIGDPVGLTVGWSCST
jgi:hypothetical protein